MDIVERLRELEPSLTVGKDCKDAADEIARLRDENAKLLADAERLDWLTFHVSGKALRDIGIEWGCHSAARAAIDAAMQKGE